MRAAKDIVMVGVPLITVGVALPLLLGAVPRNGFYGFRTSKSLSSDATWYSANRALGVAFISAGLVALVLNLFTNQLLKSTTEEVRVLIFTAVDTALIVIAALGVWMYSRSL